jgi:LysM repeat protein
MRKLYPLVIILTIAGVIAAIRYGEPAARPVARDTDFEKLENSIIVSGITADAGRRQGEPESDDEGKIIIDDSFASPGSGIAHSSPHEPFQREFTQIRKKDRRWHLTRYTIRGGDNLWTIARKFKTDHRLIIKANNITNQDMLGRDTTILVPNRFGVDYLVKKNDTLSAIARKFSVDADSIKTHNGILNGKIAAGGTLFIPDARPIRKIERRETAKSRTADLARKQTREPREPREPRFAFRWPLGGRITSSFGRRVSPITGERSFHTGMDIGCPIDTPVKAAASGKVIYSGWKDIFGNMVIIKHDRGYISVYAHNKTNIVREDDLVKAGDIIARSGMTGSVTGPHLHFEIRKHLTPLNPRRFLR